VKGTSKFQHFKVRYTELFIVGVQKYTKISSSAQEFTPKLVIVMKGNQKKYQTKADTLILNH